MTTASAKLSRNNQLVFDQLTGSSSPLSAYDLLDRLREEGLRAPPQIYRALKWLSDEGLVHRLASTNTYVACAHATCCAGEECANGQSVFFLCDGCGAVEETADEAIENPVLERAASLGFQLSSTNLEIHGLCKACQVTA